MEKCYNVNLKHKNLDFVIQITGRKNNLEILAPGNRICVVRN